MNRITKFSLLILIFLTPVLLFAETIHLNNGQVLEGNVINQTKTSVTLKLGDGKMITLQKANITRIQYNPTDTADKKRAEEKRLADLRKKADEKRLADLRKKADEKRLADEQKKADEKRLADEQKKADEKRLADEQKKAEEKRLADEQKKADEKRLADEQKKADKKVKEAVAVAPPKPRLFDYALPGLYHYKAGNRVTGIAIGAAAAGATIFTVSTFRNHYANTAFFKKDSNKMKTFAILGETLLNAVPEEPLLPVLLAYPAYQSSIQARENVNTKFSYLGMSALLLGSIYATNVWAVNYRSHQISFMPQHQGVSLTYTFTF